MKTEDVMNLPGDNHPVLCTDGKIGMVLVYPVNGSLCGIQVPGEDEHRWIEAADIAFDADGLLRQTGAPITMSDLAKQDIAQVLLNIDWLGRRALR